MHRHQLSYCFGLQQEQKSTQFPHYSSCPQCGRESTHPTATYICIYIHIFKSNQNKFNCHQKANIAILILNFISICNVWCKSKFLPVNFTIIQLIFIFMLVIPHSKALCIKSMLILRFVTSSDSLIHRFDSDSSLHVRLICTMEKEMSSKCRAAFSQVRHSLRVQGFWRAKKTKTKPQCTSKTAPVSI